MTCKRPWTTLQGGGGVCSLAQSKLHCKKNPIYVFLFWESHTSVPISTFMCLWTIYVFPHISCNRIGRPILEIYKSLTGIWNWETEHHNLEITVSIHKWGPAIYIGFTGPSFAVYRKCSDCKAKNYLVLERYLVPFCHIIYVHKEHAEYIL
jgi:hypothetical protein